MKVFNNKFIKKNCGCYSQEKLRGIYTENSVECFEEELCDVTSEMIINSTIPLKDKYWFFCKKLFTKEDNQQIAIHVAEAVLPIYEEKYPDNKAPREAIELAKLYITEHISLDKLLKARKAAADAAAAAAAYADAAADAAADYAADADATAAAAAAYYQNKLLTILKEFVNKYS